MLQLTCEWTLLPVCQSRASDCTEPPIIIFSFYHLYIFVKPKLREIRNNKVIKLFVGMSNERCTREFFRLLCYTNKVNFDKRIDTLLSSRSRSSFFFLNQRERKVAYNSESFEFLRLSRPKSTSKHKPKSLLNLMAPRKLRHSPLNMEIPDIEAAHLFFSYLLNSFNYP